MKKIAVGLVVFFGIILFSNLTLFAQEDRLVITTYYPSPSGSYGNLGADKLGVSVTGSPSAGVGQPQVAVASEFTAMRIGDAHIGWSMIVGSGGTSGWAYDEIPAGNLPGDGVLLVRNQLKIGATTAVASVNTTALDVQNPQTFNSFGAVTATTDLRNAAIIRNVNNVANNNGLLVSTIRTNADTNAFEVTSGATGATTSRFFVQSDGMVGINQPTPAVRLEVRSDSAEALRLSTTGTAFTTWMSFRNGTAAQDGLIGMSGAFLASNSIAGALALRNNTGIQLTNSNDGNNGMNIVGGNVGIGMNPTSRFCVSSLPSSGSAANVVVDGTGQFFISTSSKRFKEDIKDYHPDSAKILQVKPKSFVYKTTHKADIGYIAEDFEALGLKDLVIYDDKGLASAIKYDRIPLYLVEIVKAQETKIADLEKRIKALEEKK